MARLFGRRIDLSPKPKTPKGYLGKFKGRIYESKGEFAFISWRSIQQIEGDPVQLPTEDLFVHLKENPRLGEPIPEDITIYFFLWKKDGKLQVNGAYR